MLYPEIYEELSESQMRLVCLMAYTGCNTDTYFLQRASKYLNCTQKEIKKNLEFLQNKGIVMQSSGYSYWRQEKEYRINTYHHFLALFWVYEKHPDWLKAKTTQEDYAVEVNDTIKAVVEGNADKIKLKYDEVYSDGCVSDNVITVLSWGYNVPEMLPVFLNMDNEMLLGVIDERSDYTNDAITASFFKQFLDKVAVKRDKDFMKEVQPYFDGCRIINFLFNGKYEESKKGETTEQGLMMVAIRMAYARKFDEAVVYMEKALKAHNKNIKIYSHEKNVFDSNVLNFFMMLIYVLDGSVASKKKQEIATRKKTISDDVNNYPAHILGTYFMDSKMNIRTNELTRCLAKNEVYRKPEMRQMAFLLMQYFELSKQKLQFNRYYEEPDLSPECYIPAMAILRHELSPYIPISEEEKAKLRELFGGEPLLASIYRKKEWELVLEELLEIATQENNDNTNVTKATRLIYDISENSNYVEIREQKILKNGEWSAGRQLNPNMYNAGNFDMDEVDREIWMSSKSAYSMPLVSSVLTRMVGKNRVRLDTYNRRNYTHDYYDAEIREEKPFITVKRDDKKIILQTNLPSLSLLDKQVAFHIDWKNYVVTYYPMTEKEKMYFRKLFSLKNIPLEAEDKLKKLFPAISNRVELHSDFIEGGTQLEQVDGKSSITLRIIPRTYGQYMLNMFVTPAEGGKQSFAPGAGQNPSFDEVDGKRVQVMRHVRREKDNAKLFVEYLEDMDVEIQDYQADISTLQLLEFMDFAKEHAEEGILEWPEGEKLKLTSAQPQMWNVSLKKNAGWFDLEGELKIDDDTVLSIAQLLDLLGDSRGRFIRLDGDKYLSISEQLRKQLQKIDAVSSRQRGKAVIPAVGMAVLGEALSGELEVEHPKSLDDLRTKIRQSGRLKPEVPEQLNATLRDYQVDGFQWMTRLAHWGAGACLADDMGLGKTLQTIAILLDKAQQGASLVVAPASVVPNWGKEIHKFAPTLNVSILNEAADRKELLDNAGKNDIVVSTYGLLVTEEEIMTKKKWNVICLDEAHSIKNRDTKTSASAMKLEGEHRIILTGTPIQNHLGELWNLFQFINPGLLGSYEQFQKKYIIPISQDHDTMRQQQLKRLVAPFMLRRTKQEVVEELPDKTEITHTVQLSDEEMAVYEVIRRKAKKELEELEASGKALNINALAEITRLRQCACSASLVKKGWGGSSIAKLDAFEQLASDIHQAGNRTLVFSQFTSFLELAAKRLDNLKIPYFYLDGSTPMRKRTQMVDAFQKGECPIFLISLKAGGLGLNLTGANYVIHLDPWWNPAIEQQATDRAYRIGQRQNVTVYHLISANTIEEKILRLHDAKRNLATSLLEGTDTSHKITASQLLKMIDEG